MMLLSEQYWSIKEEIQLTYFIQINSETKVVIGYSSSKMNDSDIEMEEQELTEKFLTLPLFHRYDEATNSFIFDEVIKQKILEARNNVLSNEQKLGQQVSSLEIQMLMMQQMMQMQSQPAIQPTAGI